MGDVGPQTEYKNFLVSAFTRRWMTINLKFKIFSFSFTLVSIFLSLDIKAPQLHLRISIALACAVTLYYTCPRSPASRKWWLLVKGAASYSSSFLAVHSSTVDHEFITLSVFAVLCPPIHPPSSLPLHRRPTHRLTMQRRLHRFSDWKLRYGGGSGMIFTMRIEKSAFQRASERSKKCI